MPVGITYNVTYLHKRKEVVVAFQVGSMPPIQIVMGAEAFCQDMDYIRNDKRLAAYFDLIKERKDLPIDHDFGPAGGELKFDPGEWENRMGSDDG